MKKLLPVLIVLLCVFSLLVCVGCKQTQSDKLQTTATVELKGNPTTGYTWIYTIAPEGIIKEQSNDYVQDSNPQGAEGVGGVYSFTFEAVTEGEAEITFTYLRVWENNPGLEVVVYKAVVDADGYLKLEEVQP